MRAERRKLFLGAFNDIETIEDAAQQGRPEECYQSAEYDETEDIGEIGRSLQNSYH